MTARSDSSAVKPLRIAGLVSGGGRTLLNIHECISRGELNARIALAICSRAHAPAVGRLRDAGIDVHIVDRATTPDPDFHERIAERLRDADIELVCMAGFFCMWRIPDDFAGRVINIHPALLPDFGGRGFYGDRVHQAVLSSGATESGCTIHFADNEYDHGPIILQRRVPVLESDTPASLSARVFEQELLAFPEVIRRIISGQIMLAPTST